MQLLVIIAMLIGLAACTVPSREFRGLPAQRITVEAVSYTHLTLPTKA